MSEYQLPMLFRVDPGDTGHSRSLESSGLRQG